MRQSISLKTLVYSLPVGSLVVAYRKVSNSTVMFDLLERPQSSAICKDVTVDALNTNPQHVIELVLAMVRQQHGSQDESSAEL